MSNVPRGWTTNEGRQLADTARWPVLAQLPDASADTLPERFVKPAVQGGIEYRFDPPQAGNSGTGTPGSTQAAASRQPHMFERDRPLGQRGFPRRDRDSSVLPRTNPFSNPRPRLVDSVAPAVRFLTMAALFAAVGVWVQMLGHHTPSTRSIELPTTAAQPASAPSKNADDHTVPAPTATGPIETQPESGARVGRVEGDDFATQSNSAAGPVPSASPSLSPPHFLISSGSQVPRVRVADSNPKANADATQGATAGANSASSGGSADGTASDGMPTVARYPGFLMDIPTR